jgi:hypothetical protein
MSIFFACYIVLGLSYPTRHHVYSSNAPKPSCQEFEMQKLGRSTCHTEKSSLGEENRTDSGAEKESKRTTDSFAVDVATSKRIWGEWWTWCRPVNKSDAPVPGASIHLCLVTPTNDEKFIISSFQPAHLHSITFHTCAGFPHITDNLASPPFSPHHHTTGLTATHSQQCRRSQYPLTQQQRTTVLIGRSSGS